MLIFALFFCASKTPAERHHWLCVIYLILRTLFFFTCGTLVVCLSSRSFHLSPFLSLQELYLSIPCRNHTISRRRYLFLPIPRCSCWGPALISYSSFISTTSLPPDVLFDGEDPCVVDDHRSFTPLFHDPPRRIRCPTCALDWFPRPQVLMYYIRRVVLLACCRAPYVSYLAPI